MNELTEMFEGKQLRIIDRDGELWFVAKDVATALEYTNPTKAVNDHCKGLTRRSPLQTSGGIQELRIINEADLYRLIIGSTMPEAARFEKWVFEKVLPSIRKTGSYSVAIPKTYAEALQLAADQAKEIEQKSQALIEAAPKIESYDAMMKSEATMNISRCAKHFALHPKKVVFPYLRAHGYLIKDDLPSQSAINADILALVQNKERFTEIVHLQAVVRTRQLEKWRTYLVPRIIAWDKEREGDQDE